MEPEAVVLAITLFAVVGVLRVLNAIGKGMKTLLNHVIPDERQDKNSKNRDSKNSFGIMIPKNEREKEAL